MRREHTRRGNEMGSNLSDAPQLSFATARVLKTSGSGAERARSEFVKFRGLEQFR
jgi:hypothetical protein